MRPFVSMLRQLFVSMPCVWAGLALFVRKFRRSPLFEEPWLIEVTSHRSACELSCAKDALFAHVSHEIGSDRGALDAACARQFMREVD